MSIKPIYAQIDEYLDHCIHNKQSNMTLGSKRHTYKHFVMSSGVTSMQELTNDMFNLWLAAQTERGVSKRTINTRMAHVLAMIRYYREMGVSVPIKLPLIKKFKVSKKTPRVSYKPAEIDFMLEQADDMSWLLNKIAFDTGMRISELRNMRLEQLTNRRIDFIGKGDKDRESHMSKESRERLDTWIDERGITDYIWARNNGNPYSVDEIRIIMRKPWLESAKLLMTSAGAKKSGLKDPEEVAERMSKFHPHSLRRSLAKFLLAQGAELLEIQEMMGHEDLATTQIYIRGLDDNLGDLFDKYTPDEQPGAAKEVSQAVMDDKLSVLMDSMITMQEMLIKMQSTR